jgi:hypothetical protein
VNEKIFLGKEKFARVEAKVAGVEANSCWTNQFYNWKLYLLGKINSTSGSFDAYVSRKCLFTAAREIFT